MADNNNQAYWEVMGGNNDTGIGSNSHYFSNKNGEKQTNVLIDIGMKMGEKYNEIPDVKKELDNADALVFTHCHADHIQGLIDYVNMGYDFKKSYQDENGKFLRKPVPVIGSSFTVNYIKAELARGKVSGNIIKDIVFIAHDANKEHIKDLPENLEGIVSTEYQQGQDGKERLKVSVGKKGAEVNISLYDVDHSAKGSVAVGVEMPTPKGTYRVLHLGDWKQEDAANTITDFEGLKEFSKKGFDAVLMDSTSTVKPETLNHEVDVKNSIVAKVKEAFSEIAAEDGAKRVENQKFDIVHSSIARSANRIFDCDIIGTTQALMDMGRIKSGDTVNVFMHGGADFTRNVLQQAAAMSDSKQYKVLKNFEESAGIKFNFRNGKEATRRDIYIAMGDKETELKQLGEAVLKYTEGDKQKKALAVLEGISKRSDKNNENPSEIKGENNEVFHLSKLLKSNLSFVTPKEKAYFDSQVDKDAIHVTTGTQADELAQLKKLSMEETRDASSLPKGDNAIYIETQTPIPTGHNVENVAIMNEDLKEVFRKFKTGVHSSGHASKADSDKMIDFLMSNNPNKNAKIFPVHGAFSQNHLDATSKGLEEKGYNVEIVRNGYKMSYESGEISISKTKERGSVRVVEGPLTSINETNPYGDDINDASKRGKAENKGEIDPGRVYSYIDWENSKSFSGKSYVLMEPDGKMNVVKDVGGTYEAGEAFDINNIKKEEKEQSSKNNNHGNNNHGNKQNNKNNNHGNNKGKFNNNHGGRGGR